MATSARPRREHGFVSPKKVSALQAGAQIAGQRQTAHPDFVYNNGPVIASPKVYTSFWGAMWSDAAHTQRASRLNQFIQDLVQSEYMNVLSQYGVGIGQFVKATSLPDVPRLLDTDIIATNIQRLIDAGALPEPPSSGNNIALMIYLDEGTTVNQPDMHFCQASGDFGFHFNFETRVGHDFYYAVVPALDDTCVRTTCNSATDCSLTLTQMQEQRVTQVSSHEFAEMCTDPKVGSGWFGTTSDENGDICNGLPGTITVEGRTWTVQRQYSKTDDENGAAFCVIGASKPMAKLPGGPT